MKKIEIKEISDEPGNIKSIQISEQTHRGTKFGFRGNRSFICSNGFELWSDIIPEAGNPYLCLRGDDTNKDDMIIDVPDVKDWIEKMRVAIKEYNDFFSDCNNCEDRKCNDCKLG